MAASRSDPIRVYPRESAAKVFLLVTCHRTFYALAASAARIACCAKFSQLNLATISRDLFPISLTPLVSLSIVSWLLGNPSRGLGCLLVSWSAMRRSASLNASLEVGSKTKPLERSSKEFSVCGLQFSVVSEPPN
jgi:hypothetical protein